MAYQIKQVRLLVAEIIQARKRRGLRPSQVAELTGLRPGTISDLEKGKSWPDFSTLGLVAWALELTSASSGGPANGLRPSREAASPTRRQVMAVEVQPPSVRRRRPVVNTASSTSAGSRPAVANCVAHSHQRT